MKLHWTYLALTALLFAGCASAAPEAPNPEPSPSPSSESAKSKPAPKAPAKAPTKARAGTKTATSLLAQIEIKDAYSMSSYSREAFRHWSDADGNGCDARDDVLASENKVVPKPACTDIVTGEWYSPFDDETITSSREADVDHMVPLAEAWRSGAAEWDDTTRESYANDLSGPSLIAVTASSNRSKGDKDPTAWMPHNEAYRCTYLKNWITIKWRWRLAMDAAEHQAVTQKIEGCSVKEQTVTNPTRAKITAGRAEVDTPAPADPPAPKPAPAPTPSSPSDNPKFGSCAKAQAAGFGPYRRGTDPEYAWYRDGDGDGDVCE